MEGTYTCTKRYGHDQGLSAVFRQHRAASHCAQLHGYALSFSFQFAADRLDENGWVVDFGSLKPLRAWLQDHFDHTLLVAGDDPKATELFRLGELRLAKVLVFPGGVGCEAFARLAWSQANQIVHDQTENRVSCTSCTVAEHDGNSATYKGPPPVVSVHIGGDLDTALGKAWAEHNGVLPKGARRP